MVIKEINLSNHKLRVSYFGLSYNLIQHWHKAVKYFEIQIISLNISSKFIKSVTCLNLNNYFDTKAERYLEC